jgi:hypothetical protein
MTSAACARAEHGRARSSSSTSRRTRAEAAPRGHRSAMEHRPATNTAQTGRTSPPNALLQRRRGSLRLGQPFPRRLVGMRR